MPKSYAVDSVGVVARDIHIVRDGINHGTVALSDFEFAVGPILVHHSAKAHLIGLFETRSKPYVSAF